MYIWNEFKWDEVKSGDKYKKFLKDIEEKYNQYCMDKDIPQLKFSDELEFLKTGDRRRFEKPYFDRRRQLSIYAIMALIYPENNEYIERLEDVICAICEEFTWILPAHRRRENYNYRNVIDLFSGETGLYLAEIKKLLINRLNPLVIDRITENIDKRILTVFENYVQTFEMDCHSNWAAVCGGSVGATFLYEAPDRFIDVKSRINTCMSNYLMGILDDGSCTEGASYWNYGFGFYVLYNDVLRKKSYGREDNFKNAKVEKTAAFLTNMCLDNNTTVSFADSASEVGYSIWLPHFLKKEYDIDMPPKIDINLNYEKFSEVLRLLLYYNPENESENLEDGEIYYDKLQCYVKRSKKFGFAVKAGNNNEEHNHNDIGSFIVLNNGKQVLCDLGAPEYTAQYFSADRYTILNASSLGHSVPIINGYEQGAGAEYNSELKVDGNKISLSLKNAYPLPISMFDRSFAVNENSLKMTDSFDKELEVTERFVTECEPVIDDGKIRIDKTILTFDKNAGTVNLHTEKVRTHSTEKVMKHPECAERKVYLIDIILNKGVSEFSIDIAFEN